MYLKNLIVCLLISCAFAQVPDRKVQPDGLVGGRDPRPGEVKYIVAIHSAQFLCGGGIISERHILTAAHCVNINPHNGKLLQPMKIIAGTNVALGYNRAQVIEIDVTRAFLPSVYYVGNPDDIAVLELKKKLDFIRYHRKIKKLSLPEPLDEDPSKYPTYEMKLVKFAGYGNTRAREVNVNGRSQIERSGAGPLRVAYARITDNPTCTRWFRNADKDSMCLSVVEDQTKTTQQGTCTGDSGSPAVYNDQVLIGLDSMGIFCDNNRAPSLFTRVSTYIPFIKKAMSNDTDGLVVYSA